LALKAPVKAPFSYPKKFRFEADFFNIDDLLAEREGFEPSVPIVQSLRWASSPRHNPARGALIGYLGAESAARSVSIRGNYVASPASL
jgi:hypothetical protein